MIDICCRYQVLYLDKNVLTVLYCISDGLSMQANPRKLEGIITCRYLTKLVTVIRDD